MKSFRLIPKNPRSALVAAFALAQGAVGVAFAQSTQPATTPPAQPVKTAAQPAGVIVTIDPVTKKIVPSTPADVQALADAQSLTIGTPEGAPKVTLHRYGMKSVLLPESFMETAIATLGPGGKVSFRCVHGQECLSQGLKPMTPAAGATPSPAATPGANRASIQPTRPQLANPAIRLEEK